MRGVSVFKVFTALLGSKVILQPEVVKASCQGRPQLNIEGFCGFALGPWHYWGGTVLHRKEQIYNLQGF